MPSDAGDPRGAERLAVPGISAPASIEIPAPAGMLEALVSEPRGTVLGTAVICHPNPLQQGTMHNKVVFTMARAFERAGIVAARFNFRGVGGSSGGYGGGEGELEDALAVGRWLEARWSGVARYAAGFSFGAMIAFAAAARLDARALVTVAPPAARLAAKGLAPPACPWLLIQGDRDTVTPTTALEAWLETLARRPQLEIVAGAEHFFHGRLKDIASRIESFLAGLGDETRVSSQSC